MEKDAEKGEDGVEKKKDAVAQEADVAKQEAETAEKEMVDGLETGESDVDVVEQKRRKNAERREKDFKEATQ